MAKIAFLGLGRMGVPMASRLLAAGHDLVVWNRTAERAEPLAKDGAVVADTPGEAGRGAEIAITMLADERAVSDVVLGADGLARGLSPGSLLIDMSTVGPDAVRELRVGLPEEIGLVDAPVLGSVPQAEGGELKIFVGGSRGEFERCRALLEAMGTPRLVGELGAGAGLKLVVNSTLGAVMVAVGEALALARALGVDQQAALDVMAGSYVGGVVKSKEDVIAGRSVEPNFRLALAAKDLRLVTQAAERNGIRLRTAEANRLSYEEATEAGRGDDDYGAIVTFLRDRAAEPS